MHLRLVRSVAHYNPEMLAQVFRQNHLNAVAVQGAALLLLMAQGIFMDSEWVRIPAGATVFILASMVMSMFGAITFWFRKWGTLVFICLLVTVNYMTWAWNNRPEMYLPVRDAYTYLGAYLDALVAPCGIAFHNSLAADSTVILHDPDTCHASLNGTYLAACTFLAAIWNIDPVGNNYYPTGIDRNTALFLQNIARETVQDYNNGRKQNILSDLIPQQPMTFAYFGLDFPAAR